MGQIGQRSRALELLAGKLERKIALAGTFVPAARFSILGLGRDEASDSFQEAGNPNQDDGADESDDDRAKHTSGRPNSKTAKKPATNQAAEDAEDNVHEDAIAAAFHDEPSEPTGDKTNNDPIDHALPPLPKPECNR